MSTPAIRRLMHDLKEVQKFEESDQQSEPSSSSAINASPVDENLMDWDAVIFG